MQVTYTDDGVCYEANGVTLNVYGEQACGEVFLGDSFYGFYERTAEGKVAVYGEDDTVLGEFDVEGWEEFAADVIG